ncbi:hypothetical protein GEV33_000101 [Tenebrio molitor]|uniref:Uncharacterized protein n=1 Tax=Tenebrio molitor TaxID=7067 RepID=A0A8J6HXV3_TENMO|nr:hypothetical protein GEV33_000101 [Tenebrio molitor]
MQVRRRRRYLDRGSGMGHGIAIAFTTCRTILTVPRLDHYATCVFLTILVIPSGVSFWEVRTAPAPHDEVLSALNKPTSGRNKETDLIHHNTFPLRHQSTGLIAERAPPPPTGNSNDRKNASFRGMRPNDKGIRRGDRQLSR